MISVRREDNFQDLLKTKKIIIPIIQRDYAQGRNNTKALVVRTRLIDEWIDILQDKNLRMDFNYIYGNEDSDVFYPVDGQQRLTSLYLLHWYLAQATDNTEDIYEWQFDYKTRNSASEFFAFLREPEKSKELFIILRTDSNDEEKQTSIRNESWFKTKWENDPTVVSCVNFLCMLARKLSKYQDQYSSFGDRLKDSDCPAVYFTCLNECDDEYAEIDAAKKYTRMNARGKRLTNFENLKAMIDEIEMKHISELRYCCSADAQDKVSDTISWTYDRKYIDSFYQSLQENSLMEKTKAINDESEKWFRLVYYTYALVYGRAVPSDLFHTAKSNNNESFEDIIYKISQERVKDDQIVEYLYMMKAIFEVLCNSGDKVAYRYDDFAITDLQKRRNAIVFILFISGMWDKSNQKANNINLNSKWIQFRNMLDDLNFKEWHVSGDYEIKSIVLAMVDAIKKTSSKSVDEYFISNDFTSNNPFGANYVLSDIKCRIIERKIKSKLIYDGTTTEVFLNKAYLGKHRWGYLCYICGFLDDWKLDDWSTKSPWNSTVITDYINFISENRSMEQLMNSRAAKVVYAYSSQYDETNKSLNNASEIDKCNNEHIWNDSYLIWQDDEFDCLNENKKKQLNHFKVMSDLLLGYKASRGTSFDKLIKEYAGVINTYFNSNPGYETCWLRFAVQYVNGGKDLLTSELENEDGVVKIKTIPVILKTFLIESGYSYIEKVSHLKDFNKKCTFFTLDAGRVLYSHTDKTCTFAPDSDNSGKYQHSQKTTWGWDLSGNTVNRNMDLFYRAYFNLSGIGAVIKNNFWSIDITSGVYTIKVYEIGSIAAGKLSITVKEASIDRNILVQTESNIKQWHNRFDAVWKSPSQTGNYDRWIELWNNDYVTAFGSSFVQGTVTYDKNGGQRPRKIWSEVLSVPALTWSTSTVNI